MEDVYKGTKMTISLRLNWGFRNPQIRTKPKINKNVQILIFLSMQKISRHKNYDVLILISLNLYIVQYFWQCSNFEVPAKSRGKS